MIRPAGDSDAGALADLYNHYVEHTVTTFETRPVSPAEMGDRVAAVHKLGLPWIVLALDNEVCVYACAVRWKSREAYRHSVESTIYLARGRLGEGLGTRLYGALLDQLSALGVHAVLAGIALPNGASVGLHEKLGFEKVAHLREVGRKFDHWVDVGYWQRIISRHPDGGVIP
jgi:phosphinothricin acetyltransferase